MAVFTAVNFLAMRIFANVNSTITWWKVAVPVLAIIVLLFKFHPGNFTAGGEGFMPGGIHGLFAALPLAGIIFAYSGFEQADQLAGEIKNPGRNLPRAIIISVLIGTVIYTMLQVAFIGAMPAAEIPHGLQHITNPEIIAGPFAGVAALAGIAWLAHILRIDAFISPSGTGLIYTTGTSRVSYGLARNRYAPQIFGRTNATGVPWVGLIFAFLFGLLFLLPFPSWRSLVGIITGASVLMYAGAPLSLGAFRGQVPDANRPYRMPAAAVLAPAAFVVADLLIYWSGFEVVWKLGIVLVIGYVLIGISMAFDKDRPPLDWKSAVWLPVWLIGMGIISWQGQFPLPGAEGVAADQHLQHPVLVGHSDRRRVQPGHLLLGHGHQAAQGGDDATWSRHRQQSRAGRTADPAGPTACRRSGPTRPCGPADAPSRPGRGSVAPAGPPDSGYHPAAVIAQQHPAFNQAQGQPRRTAGCPPRRHRGCPTPATSHRASRQRRALDEQQVRLARVPGYHHLSGPDPQRPARPDAAADEQPVAGPQGGLHRPLGHRDPP